ncbi:hypothetical protein GCM10027569_09620 [Flindersiella endophytica]
MHGRWIVATDRALHVPEGDTSSASASASYERIPWEQVERGEWDHEADILRLTRLAPFGEPSDVRVLRLEHSERLLRLIRERVTASVIISQHVPLVGSRGVRVVARRPPGTAEELTWSMLFDEGVDPSDPAVLSAAEQALAAVRGEVEL